MMFGFSSIRKGYDWVLSTSEGEYRIKEVGRDRYYVIISKEFEPYEKDEEFECFDVETCLREIADYFDYQGIEITEISV